MKLGIIGAGNMASAIIGGIIKKGIIAGSDIICSSPVEAERDKAASSFGINVTADNKEVVAKSEILLLAVKPQVIPIVAAEIKDDLKDDQLIISIVAGKAIAWYNEAFGRELKIIRTMPNTPALVGEGMTGVSPASTVTEEETKKAVESDNDTSRIRTPASEARRNRNILLYIDADAQFAECSAIRIHQSLNRFECSVPAVSGHIILIAFQCNRFRLNSSVDKPYAHLVKEINRLHHHPKVMIPVCPLPQYIQGKIYFSISLQL